MAQPKKLTHKQKHEKKLLDSLERYKTELKNLRKTIINKPGEKDTWQWAAMQIFRDLGTLEKHPEVDKCREYALKLARDACNSFTL